MLKSKRNLLRDNRCNFYMYLVKDYLFMILLILEKRKITNSL